MTSMNSSRPYLVSAIHDWIVDNNCTPYILVDATHPNAQVPNEYVQDGRIVLNISPTAVMSLNIGPDALEFGGRFSGVARSLYVPMEALLGIYARENGQGMLFNGNEPIISSGSAEVGVGAEDGDAGDEDHSLEGSSDDLFAGKPSSKDEAKARLSSVSDTAGNKAGKATESSDGNDSDDEPPTQPGGGKAGGKVKPSRPSLKVVK